MDLTKRARLIAMLYELWSDDDWTLEDALICVRTAHLDWEAEQKEEE